MNEVEISNAIGQRLVALDMGLPIVFPNGPAALPAMPFIVLEVVRTGRSDPTLAGTETHSTGFATAHVISEKGVYATQALAKAQAIADGFPMGLRLPITGGSVVIKKPADILRGYADDVAWHTPVRIDYEAS